MTSEKQPSSEPTFEEALQKLEEIAQRLEEGALPLEEAIKLYEEGVRMHKQCQEKLAAARGKLEKVIQTQTGEVLLEPLEDNAPADEI